MSFSVWPRSTYGWGLQKRSWFITRQLFFSLSHSCSYNFFLLFSSVSSPSTFLQLYLHLLLFLLLSSLFLLSIIFFPSPSPSPLSLRRSLIHFFVLFFLLLPLLPRIHSPLPSYQSSHAILHQRKRELGKAGSVFLCSFLPSGLHVGGLCPWRRLAAVLDKGSKGQGFIGGYIYNGQCLRLFFSSFSISFLEKNNS